MDIFSYRLREFPTSARLLALGYILTLGFGYLYALSNIAMVIGFSPKEIAIHYYGSERVKAPQSATTEEKLDLDNMGEPEESVRPQPSLKNLVQEGHFHLFGMAAFFFGLTVLGLFTGIPEKWKCMLVGLPYLAIILDNLSFLATRFIGPRLAYLTAASGTVMAVCFASLWLSVAYELIQKPARGGIS